TPSTPQPADIVPQRSAVRQTPRRQVLAVAMILSYHDTIMAQATLPPNRVRAYRRERNWSQADLAQRAAISRTAVSAIEINRLVPSVAAALALAAAFGCTVED